MNTRKRILLIALFVLVMCGLGLVLFLFREPAEPRYNGKPLTYWLTGYAPGQYQVGSRPDYAEADRAVRQMGTNCLPRLLRMLQRHDSPCKSKVRALLDRQKLFNIRLFQPDQDLEAYFGLLALASGASNAVPELIRISDTDSSANVQQWITGILGNIGPIARQAIPTLLRDAFHTNNAVRYNAVWALGHLRAEPEKVVPALMKCLDDPDLFVRAQAMQGLGWFDTNALSSVPMLVEMLRKEIAKPSGTSQWTFVFNGSVAHGATDTNEMLCTNAVYALGRIHADADDVVPVLMKCLGNANPTVQAQAIGSLGEFGTNASPALPTLVKILRRERANPADNPMGVHPSRSELIEIAQDAIKSINSGAVQKPNVSRP